MKYLFYFFGLYLLLSCSKVENSAEFMDTFRGRYLFNSNETLAVSFENEILKIRWRNRKMTPVKINDSSFYLKEMNEKLVFIASPKICIKLSPKREHKGELFYFIKLSDEQKTPTEYFKDQQYEKALQAYIAIQRKDSLDPSIRQKTITNTGYEYLRGNEFKKAKELFKISIALYPKKSKGYNSMGDALKQEGDTLKAIQYYQRALKINPENNNSLRNLKNLTSKN